MSATSPGPFRSAALFCLLVLTANGCGLSAELDREANPGRTPTPTPSPAVVKPSPPPPDATPAPSPSVPGRQVKGCPKSGLRFAADRGDAAMGLRAMGLDVTNCGDRPYTLNGYPAVTVLDGSGDPFPGVRTVEGTDQVPMAPEDPGPRPLTLAPGRSAHAALYWRMHNTPGVYLRVAPRQGDTTVTVQPPYPLDIGPENVLGTTAWQPSQAR
ncbi:hypothetical protein QFZ75_001596 [Streptomyces sp. V3I8]|uniref:DUF4232 domain-containing protein n=1 Tax=Streptomyces sp. V3I8 TaxID=3042279 RepID=UPI00278948B4|nr:DUF4232 domain-containing protein [Streptomyces sp. V3I8]MDQ1035180.1 hypothetical protein [Streptomyces sp. V3I8]